MNYQSRAEDGTLGIVGKEGRGKVLSVRNMGNWVIFSIVWKENGTKQACNVHFRSV